jgi:hypothetical protein
LSNSKSPFWRILPWCLSSYFEDERRENGIDRQGGAVHPRPKRVIFLQLCSHIPISVQTKRSKVPGRVTPGFNETRDGPLGALSEVDASRQPPVLSRGAR